MAPVAAEEGFGAGGGMVAESLTAAAAESSASGPKLAPPALAAGGKQTAAEQQQAFNPYQVLNVNRKATATEIRRAFKTLATRLHPDKGGDEHAFAAVRRAHDVLSDSEKRRMYDETGKVEKTPDEELLDSFGGGAYRDRMERRRQEEERESMADALTVRQDAESHSHTARFEAFMRSRGDAIKSAVTDSDIVETFGVDSSGYVAVPLPRVKCCQATVTRLGKPVEVVKMSFEELPAQLEYGQVLVTMLAAPISTTDLITCQVGSAVPMGGPRGGEAPAPPFAAGWDAVCTVGPGCTRLREGDWALPLAHPSGPLGTWRPLAVLREKDLIKIPKEWMAPELAASWRSLCCAYRLLEDAADVLPGCWVALNAANSTVGRVVIQLCKMLRLHTVAVIRKSDNYESLAQSLTDLGADLVLPDEGSIKHALETNKSYARLKLTLDGVGGYSAVRLAESLCEGGSLVVYACASAKPPTFAWHQWVCRDLHVRGFSLAQWVDNNRDKLLPMLEQLAKLVNTGKIDIPYTEYDMATEFTEALEHACEERRNTKIILRWDQNAIVDMDMQTVE
eukprot:jgi/Chlat1/1446/Chrsp12S08681